MFPFALLALLPAITPAAAGQQVQSAPNSTWSNPIIPGFHPDPSCIYVPEWDETFFCASSSFNAFPGVPLHASKDLRTWELIGHVLNRPEQLPSLASTNGSTSGIWAPSIRFHEGMFYVVTTLVFDNLAKTDNSRWDNMIFKAENPYDPASWSIPVHFSFSGYDTSPFWDADGKVYITGSHVWEVTPGIQLAEVDLNTGDLITPWQYIWNGTGGESPEGPHLYTKDGYYYLMIAEGGTGLNHMETIARSRTISGSYESNPLNPVLTNANTTAYFQTVGHADLFQDPSGNWWGVALSTRSGPDYLYYPMGRETIMTAVSWPEGEWPVFTHVQGEMSGWPMPPTDAAVGGTIETQGEHLDFAPGSSLPLYFTYWRFPVPSSYAVSPPEHPFSLRLLPSALNLTALDGNYAGPAGQTFVSRRQQDTLFTFGVDLDYDPSAPDEEAGVSVFLTQNHHLDMGVVMLPANATDGLSNSSLAPFIRYRGISYTAVPDPVVMPVPQVWLGRTLRLEIRAANMTHYSFSVGPADARSAAVTLLYVSNAALSWGFTGTLLGVYCTSNGGLGTTPAYFSNWNYVPQGQFRD